jgi:hypothetical protein
MPKQGRRVDCERTTRHPSVQIKNTNDAKSEVRFKKLIRDLSSVLRSQSTLQRQQEI